jgi:hypothetical protein
MKFSGSSSSAMRHVSGGGMMKNEDVDFQSRRSSGISDNSGGQVYQGYSNEVAPRGMLNFTLPYGATGISAN